MNADWHVLMEEWRFADVEPRPLTDLDLETDMHGDNFAARGQSYGAWGDGTESVDIAMETYRQAGYYFSPFAQWRRVAARERKG